MNKNSAKPHSPKIVIAIGKMKRSNLKLIFNFSKKVRVVVRANAWRRVVEINWRSKSWSKSKTNEGISSGSGWLGVDGSWTFFQ